MNNNTLDNYGIEIKVDEVIERTNSFFVDAYLFKVAVYNLTETTKKVNILKSEYLTSKREQMMQDSFNDSYMKDEDILLPKSYKKTAIEYFKSKLKNVVLGDILTFNIELVEEGVKFIIDFQNKNNGWEIINVQQSNFIIKKSKAELEKYLINHIERLPAFEERLNIELQNISIQVNNEYHNYIVIFCEVHSTNGNTLNNSLQLEYILYDKEGSILSVSVYHISSNKFFGFEVCNESISCDNIENIGKIRIYPHS